MISSLQIKDYALIENIEVEFYPGLNIITGETGAGKSILIGALSLLLGERASSDTVRKGAKKSIVEGIFDVGQNEKVKELFKTNNIDFHEDLIIRREISLKGSNRCFVNDSPVQLSIIKQIGDLLIDLHGQHDHQSLLNNETHIDFLDEFCDLKDQKMDYSQTRAKFLSLLHQIEELKKNEQDIKEKLELNQFKLKEINAVDPHEDEDISLERELNILENSEKLYQISTQIYSAIYEEDIPAHDQLVNIQNMRKEILKIDDSLSSSKEEIDSAVALLQDVGDSILNYKDRIEIDPESLNEKRERAGAINLLKKKYGGSLKNVLEIKSKFEEEISLVENFSDRIEDLTKNAEIKREELSNKALKLSSIRKKKALEVEKLIEEALKYLGIGDSRFEIRFDIEPAKSLTNLVEFENQKVSFFSNGVDIVEFFISTNKGEDPKPLSKTASGGEVSRIMLAIKNVLAKTEKLPLLVFDEIDTGISGRIAQKVGKVLKDLSESHQIIAITHLPQIAAFAQYHFSVIKKINSGRSISSIVLLSRDDRVVEIAKLLSGEKITDSNLATANELINSTY